jgi:hypothetical protein
MDEAGFPQNAGTCSPKYMYHILEDRNNTFFITTQIKLKHSVRFLEFESSFDMTVAQVNTSSLHSFYIQCRINMRKGVGVGEVIIAC